MTKYKVPAWNGSENTGQSRVSGENWGTLHKVCCCCSVTQSYQTVCDSMNGRTPGYPVLHCLPEFAQAPVCWVNAAIQPSHPLSSPSPPALNKVSLFLNEIPLTTHSVQFSSVAQSCLTLCDPMNRSTPGLPVHHQLPEFSQTHVHLVSDTIQPSHPLSSLSPPAPNPSQHQSLFQWVNSSHEVAKVLEFQL